MRRLMSEYYMQLSHIFLTVHWWHDRGRPVILPFERKKILKHLLIPASDIPTFFSFLVGLWHGSTSSMMNFLNFSVSGWIWSLMRETTSLTVETPIFLFWSPLVWALLAMLPIVQPPLKSSFKKTWLFRL